MMLKNLLRRKGRTLLTIFGVAVGVAAIIGLGAMADGLEAGYSSMLSGAKADLVFSQPDAFDISYSAVDESLLPELTAMPEVDRAAGMLQGFVTAENSPLLFVFGHPLDSFILDRFQIVEGYSLTDREAQKLRGTPVLLGTAAAESFNKKVGDTLLLGGQTYRIVGLYETGDPFEDAGAVLELREAQELLGRPRQVSLFYIQLKDPSLSDRLIERASRLWPDYDLSGTSDFANSQIMDDYLRIFVWVIAGLAILIGGVGMMNAQLMAVVERTSEIGVLRAVGWRRWRVLGLILGEAMIVGMAGGVLGIGLGWFSVYIFSDFLSIFGATTDISPQLIGNAFITVVVLGLVGGLYPAWRASRLEPVEALRYEGGTGSGGARRLPIGGMAANSLWQRSSRTLLTLSAIGLTVGSILALDAIIAGTTETLTGLALGSDAEIMIRQADIADTSLSAIDEQTGKKIAALPEVNSVSGMAFTAVVTENNSFFFLIGLNPNEFAIRKYVIVEGERISGNRQIMIGNSIAQSLNKTVGDSIELAGTRYRIAGIYDAGGGWEELGGIVTLRDAQIFMGRPRKVTMYLVKLEDPRQASEVVEIINTRFPDAHAALSGEFANQMPDMQNVGAMTGGMSFLAIIVGGVGVMNTMLMAVLERTREIGVLRALGWRRRAILRLILREALLMGFLGGIMGVLVAFGLKVMLEATPFYGDAIDFIWQPMAFIRAFLVAALLGLFGGLYPAFRATQLQPVEALRYE
ncbi:MAG TPA: FtsX-like permease family protein [Anaerolineales bacterium]|nr:FtsX-like permease family protein [Anaerolineales bacterium]